MTTRRAIVTGAGGGIGRAIVEHFAAAGWDVIGIDRRDIDDELPVSRFLRADLSHGNAVDEIHAELGIDGLDALVNNAAVQINRPLVETTDADWDLVMNTNVRSAFQMIRAFSTELSSRRGAVVNISSVHAIATSENVAAYAISKGALSALTRSAALELAEIGIRCNAVLPGAVLTPMLEDGLSRRPHPDGPSGNLRNLSDRTPLGFVATPAQIAPSVLHLADSELSPYTTGQLMVVDGGAVLRLGTE